MVLISNKLDNIKKNGNILESGCFLTVNSNKVPEKLDPRDFERQIIALLKIIDNFVVCKYKNVLYDFKKHQAGETFSEYSIEIGQKQRRVHAHIKLIFYTRNYHAFLDTFKMKGFLNTTEVMKGYYTQSHRFVTENSLAQYMEKSKYK